MVGVAVAVADKLSDGPHLFALVAAIVAAIVAGEVAYNFLVGDNVVLRDGHGALAGVVAFFTVLLFFVICIRDL